MKLKSRYPERVEYESDTAWDGQTGCVAAVSNGRKIVSDTPKSYGGRGEGICPDEIFVSSLLSCLNNTFLDFQRRFEMELKALDLSGKAMAEFDGTGYRITGLKISGQIVVGEDDLATGERCVELMKEYCHISRSLDNCIPIEYNIDVREE
jgi:organic hydroperoxide reductase OsmC/OhrA